MIVRFVVLSTVFAAGIVLVNALPAYSQLTKTICAVGCDFTTFSAAIADANANFPAGGVIYNVTAGETFNEPTPADPNAGCVTAQGSAGVANQITFQRSGAGANPVIVYAGVAGAGIPDSAVCIRGGDYITFNGIDVSSGGSTTLENGYRIVNASDVNGATNNTIQNTAITLNRAGTATVGIFQSTVTGNGNGAGVTPTAASGANSNNRYYNLTIRNVYSGIYLLGTGTFPDQNCEIGVTGSVTANNIGDTATPNDIGGTAATTWGIHTAQQSGVRIFNNNVQNVFGTGSNEYYGIWFEVFGAGNTFADGQIYNNKVSNISRITATTNTATVYGMRVDAVSGNAATVYNNFVSNLNYSNPATAVGAIRVRGIAVNAGGNGGNINVFFNSVRLDQGVNAGYGNAAFFFNAGTTTSRNNIFSNFTGAQSGVAFHYAYHRNGGTITATSNNDLYIADTNNGNTGFFAGFAGGANRPTLADWATASGETNSIAADPLFVSTTDLHIGSSSPAMDLAFFGTGITTDIDGQTRSSTPDIGADEQTPSSATASIGGRVVDANGRGISGARIIVSGGTLTAPLPARTSTFGYYRIDGLPTGGTYNVQVSAKRYTFGSRVISLSDNALDVNFMSKN